MPKNVFMDQVAVNESHQPLGDSSVFTVDVSCPPTNSGPVFFRAHNGVEVPWIPGEWHNLRRIRLSDVTVRGTPGDVVSIIGGIW